MNGHSSRPASCTTPATPTHHSICCFEGGTIKLKSTATTALIPIDAFEDAMDDGLNSTDDFPVQYPQPNEALLLQCRLPKVKKSFLNNSANPKEEVESPLASITGIPEEHDEKTDLLFLNVSAYEGFLAKNTDSSHDRSCNCQVPLSTWTRRNLSDRSSVLYRSSSNSFAITWVDLRHSSSSSNQLVPSLTSAAHFLRSLLGTSHAASPWCTETLPPKDSRPQRVAVVFASNAPDYLIDIRVNDICPSWYLYSISSLQIPSSWKPWETTYTNEPQSASYQLQPATLVVYKPLPPRPLLTLVPPPGIAKDETHLSSLPEGCLWETYFEYQEDGSTNVSSKNGKINEKTKQARKIPHVRMTAPPYVSYTQDYNEQYLRPLLENWKTIRDEALRISQWTAWPERQHYSRATHHDNDDDIIDAGTSNGYDNPSWTVFPLCHCFPANQPENKKWIERTCALVPKTIQLLEQHLGPVLRTALFSRLDPETTLEAHTGWSDLANHVMRCHLPLTVPPGDVCRTWVDGCVETHREGRLLCFDDSKTHRAFNYSSEERIVLILDLARPPHLPQGTATGGHTDELDQFIASMNI